MTVDTVRARDLARMRALATGLLGLMAAVFIAASLAQRRWPLLGFVRAFAEAAMVGACADWFAVTALFRRPFGLPIPHTAVIARNKTRIGAALGGFVADNFLTEAALAGQLQQLELARWGGAWLRRPNHARSLAERMVRAAPKLVAAFPREAARELLSSGARAAAAAIPAAPAASKLLAAVWRDGRAEAWLDLAITRLAPHLAEHQNAIQAKVEAQTYAWLPKWIDRMIAQKITAGALQWLEDIRAPDHPWRAQLHATVERLIARLADDPEILAQGEAIKARLLADPRLAEHAAELWTHVEVGIATGLAERGDAAIDALERLLLALGVWLDADAGVQTALNRSARRLALDVLAPRRASIGASIARVVDGWDASLVVEKLELQVGRDLQFIRINGTLVGGLVGLAIFTIGRWTGLSAP